MTDKFETRLVHAARSRAAGDGVSSPIELSTSFVRDDPRDDQSLIYARLNNPNRELLEQRLAAVENGAQALAFASGSAASLAVFQSLPPGSHVVITEDAYYGTVLQLQEMGKSLGHSCTCVDTSRIENVRQAMQKSTQLIWLETPSNPLMRVADIKAIADLAHQNDALLCVDNTVATSVLQKPLDFAADYSMHSATKYIGGHSDVTAGVLIAREANAHSERLRQIQRIGGATPSPFDCWLLVRSLSTMALRVRQQQQNAHAIASFLSQHDNVEQVLYPGLKDHPDHQLALQQMQGGAALLSVLIKGTAETAIRIARSTRLFAQATSLGGVESLIEHRQSIEGEHSHSPDSLLRISVGIEHIDDLLADLHQALKQAD